MGLVVALRWADHLVEGLTTHAESRGPLREEFARQVSLLLLIHVEIQKVVLATSESLGRTAADLLVKANDTEFFEGCVEGVGVGRRFLFLFFLGEQFGSASHAEAA